MPTHISATFDVKSWDESSFDEEDQGPKVTRAVVEKEYAGEIDGTSTTQWLMAYADDGSATIVGLERLRGSVGGRQGSLVLQHIGTYGDGVAKGELAVVEGGGSGELVSTSGGGSFLADPAGSVQLDLIIG
jgi:hypothetical protein